VKSCRICEVDLVRSVSVEDDRGDVFCEACWKLKLERLCRSESGPLPVSHIAESQHPAGRAKPPMDTPRQWRVQCRRTVDKREKVITLILEAKDEAGLYQRLKREYPSWDLLNVEPAPEVGHKGPRVAAVILGALLCIFGFADWLASQLGIDMTGVRWSPFVAGVTGIALFCAGAAGTELGNPHIPDSER
jgi:hypothetical protein